MIRLLSILFLALAYTSIGLVEIYAQDSKTRTEWRKVNICQINFLLPKNLKNQYSNGIDSCVAEFRSNKMKVTIDSGHYGGYVEKNGSNLDFKEEFAEIDGRKVQLYFYKDANNKAKRRFIAGFYAELDESKDTTRKLSTFLYLTIEAKSETEIDIARQIFRSISFDVFAPSSIEW